MRKAKNKAEKKTKKYVLLATYVVAVVCLLAGLFLPLFNGKDILALQLPEALKSLLNKADPNAKNPFTLPYEIHLFGIEKLKFDFLAAVVVLYAVVTALAVLSFVPVALSVINKGKLAKKIYYAIEVLAIIVLALYFIPVAFMYGVKVSVPPEMSSLPFWYVKSLGYNMAIALGGTAIALVVLSGLDKGKTATIKIVLFLLSLIGFLALFDFVVLLSKQEAFAKITDKISSGFVSGSGVDYLTILFASKITDSLSALTELKDKALLMLASITATVVLVNFIIDTVKLATKKDKKFGRLFDVVRYGLEFAVAISTLVTAIICKATLGIMLIAISAVAVIALTITVLRFILANSKKAKKKNAVQKPKGAVNYPAVSEPAEQPVEDAPVTEYSEESATDKAPVDNFEDVGWEATPEGEQQVMEQVGEGIYEEPPAPPIPDDDGYIDPKLDEQYYQNAEVKQMTINLDDSENLEDVELYQPEENSSYLPNDETVEEPAVEVVEEPVIEEPIAEEPAVEVAEDEAFEEAIEQSTEEEIPEEYVEETEEYVEEAEEPAEEPKEEQNPFREEVKPYNPYENHNNPFRHFDDPPYNPYRQQAEPVQEPVQPKPVEPVQPKPVEQPAQQPVKPLQPRSIIQEFKPVPPVEEQPPKEPQVYTINTIYGGPTDEFISKLTNDERIEFAKTFIEKIKGNLGTIPDYVVGGNNKKFFSSVFIYLGRIRGMVSDGLLNKMYKELNIL